MIRPLRNLSLSFVGLLVIVWTSACSENAQFPVDEALTNASRQSKESAVSDAPISGPPEDESLPSDSTPVLEQPLDLPETPSESVSQENLADPITTSDLETGSESSPLTAEQLDQVPVSIRPYVKELAALGVLAIANEPFVPNAPISRRLFARWLIETHNLFFADQTSQQLRLASPNEEPIFTDVQSDNPQFPYIQTLAQTGIVSSPLAGDGTATRFMPDKPLTRETLLKWKVPLDRQAGIGPATLTQIQQTWGFQDATQIQPQAYGALVADYENAEHSNVRRSFGFTTLFQPEKIVTQAEAAAALWSFGLQAQAVTAEQVLQNSDPSEPLQSQ
ncbi:MAG: S-layer homology domain-containing protein [Cyanobacteria bacterium P01_H01_bin.15]